MSHAGYDLEYCVRNSVGGGHSSRRIDQRIVGAVYDERRYVNCVKGFGAVGLSNDRGELADHSGGMKRPIVG